MQLAISPLYAVPVSGVAAGDERSRRSWFRTNSAEVATKLLPSVVPQAKARELREGYKGLERAVEQLTVLVKCRFPSVAELFTSSASLQARYPEFMQRSDLSTEAGRKRAYTLAITLAELVSMPAGERRLRHPYGEILVTCTDQVSAPSVL